ncbi:hypothetical protein [Shewanella sp. SNU WT4]|uniref:hypothetical protein n=1 Tax=Shewanella sp. SNU WT4 TaxID=2590015 RepID=UPI001F0D520B|nr:hypothetical protein [Shewanella sp. SNU WT4]
MLALKKRNQYQTRHTAASLWLAAGQLGHANTSILFRVYSRYVPILLGQDGAVFERLIGSDSEECHQNEYDIHNQRFR